MRYTGSWEIRRALQSLALWLGVLALMLQSFTPLCLAAVSDSTSAGNSIVICTAHGFERLTLDADGKPVPGGPQSGDSSSTCSLCAGFHSSGGFVPPAFVTATVPRLAEAAPLPVSSVPVPSLPPHFSYVSRAPPASVSLS